MIVDDLDRMERLAAMETSPLYRTSPLARVAATGIFILAAVLAARPEPLVGEATFLLLLGTMAGAEPSRIALSSLAPLPFLLVAYVLHPETSGERMLLLLLRAGNSAMAVVLLLSTTTFADVLRVLGAFLPRSLVAALAVLYRSLSLLLRAAGHVRETAHLRGVRGAPGPLVGGLLLHAFERAENVACVMHVRGVDVPDPDRADALRPTLRDALPLGVALASLVGALLA